MVEVFAEAGDPLLMALFQGDGDGARQLPPWRVEDVVELLFSKFLAQSNSYTTYCHIQYRISMP